MQAIVTYARRKRTVVSGPTRGAIIARARERRLSPCIVELYTETAKFVERFTLGAPRHG